MTSVSCEQQREWMIKQYERSKERIWLCIERLSGGVVKSNDSTEQSNGADRYQNNELIAVMQLESDDEPKSQYFDG
jgi:hypothetical protein